MTPPPRPPSSPSVPPAETAGVRRAPRRLEPAGRFGRSRRVGRVGRVIAPLVAALTVCAAVVGRLDLTGPVPIAQSVAPVVGAAAAVVALAMVATRQWLTSVVTMVAALTLVWPVLPSPGGPDPDPGPGPGQITVMALNTEFGRADPVRLVAEVRRLRPDALVLTEATPALWAALERAGVRDALPYASGSTHPGSTGTVVATRHRHTCLQAPDPCLSVAVWGWVGHEAFAMPAVRLDGGVVLKAVHPYPPLWGRTDRWREDQGGLQRWVDGNDGPWVMAGDFNAGPVHPVFRRMTEGLTVAPDADHAWLRTWPREDPRMPPFVALDHVVADGLSTVDSGTFEVDGTDHVGVWAVLRPRPGG